MKVDFDIPTSKTFNQYTKHIYNWIENDAFTKVSVHGYPIFITTLISFFLANTIGFVVAVTFMPPSPLKTPVKAHAVTPIVLPHPPLEVDFKTILKRNIFNSAGGLADDEGQKQCELVKSGLPLKLSGLIFGGTAATSLALLEGSGKLTDTFLLGDVVPGGARVIDIQKDRIIIERAGCPEFIVLEKPEVALRRRGAQKKGKETAKATSPDGPSYKEDGFEREGYASKITRQWVDKALTTDFTKTLQDAKASPYLEGGEVKGFILTRIRPDSVYEKLGFQDGDIIKAINGIPLNDAAKAIQTLNGMRNENNVSMEVTTAGGQQRTFSIQVR